MCEDFCVLVIWTAEEPVGEQQTCCYGHGCEFNLSTYVAERVDVLDVGVLVLVCYDLTALILLDACFIKAEIFDFGSATDGPEETIEI